MTIQTEVMFSLDDIYLFKVRDYTAILLGRKQDSTFIIQRGDGTIYKYTEDRIVWFRKLNCI